MRGMKNTESSYALVRFKFLLFISLLNVYLLIVASIKARMRSQLSTLMLWKHYMVREVLAPKQTGMIFSSRTWLSILLGIKRNTRCAGKHGTQASSKKVNYSSSICLEVFIFYLQPSKALPDYDAAYQKHNHRFEMVLRQHLSDVININDLIYQWSFDAMGEVTFSKSFQMLTHTHSHHHLRTLRRFLGFLGPFSPTPWVINLGSSLPLVMNGWNRMFDMCQGYMMERVKVRNERSCPEILSCI